MTLMFINAFDGPAAERIAPSPSDGKRGLLAAVAACLSFPTHFRDDNLDSFYDCLTDSTGTVVLDNSAQWWRHDTRLMGQLCQCFLDARGATLLCLIAPDDDVVAGVTTPER
jgi:Barstar (barnase inhibitor)